MNQNSLSIVRGIERRQLGPEAAHLQRQRDVPRRQRRPQVLGRRREERQLPGVVQEEEEGERCHPLQPQLAVMMIKCVTRFENVARCYQITL